METSDCSPESVESILPDVPESPPKVDTAMAADAGHDQGIARAREILGSLQVRREELLNTVRESRANRTRTTNASGDTTETFHTARQGMSTNRPKTAVFDGTETQLLTAQLSKVLQDRRDRLSRILAGLDPDGADECRETSPVGSDASRSVDLGSLEAPGWSFGASPGDAKSPFRKRLDSDHSSVFTSHPPTLEEIREAFNTDTTEESTSHETVVASQDFTAEDDETSIGSTGLSLEQDSGPESIPNSPSENAGLHQQLPDRSCVDGDIDDMKDESNEIASPSARSSDIDATANHTPTSNSSSIRRAYSFEDTLVSAKDEPSIRVTLSFNSSLLDSASRLKFKPRSLNLHRVPTPPPIQSQCSERVTTKTPKKCLPSLQEPGDSVTVEQASLPPFRGNYSIQQSGSGCSAPHGLTQLKAVFPDESTTCHSPINFFPPDAPIVEKEHEFDQTNQSPVSTSSTLTSMEDRAHYLRALCDSSAVKRPVPRYPVTDGAQACLDDERRVNDIEYTNGTKNLNQRVGESHREKVVERDPLDYRIPLEGTIATVLFCTSRSDDMSPSHSFTEDPSQLISEASSFDGTYDDTVTSGYLSFGTLERRSGTLYGDDWTVASILMPNKSIESLEDGEDSIDRLLPPPVESAPGPSIPITCQERLAPENDVKLASCLCKTTTSRKHPKSVASKKVVFAPAAAAHPTTPTLSRKKPALYFVEEEVADARCHAHGGLYSIALATGLNLKSPPMEMLRIKKKTHGASNRNMRLNPDFRCGARGSLYDLCLQSGFDLTQPWEWRKKRRYLPVKGGLFDLALRSGLTMELLHSRGPLTIKTKPLSLCRQDDAEVLPEDVSDYECGATGNLFLAFESAGGDYVSKGSLYYLATQSGMKLGQ